MFQLSSSSSSTAQAVLFALNQDTIHQYTLWKTQDLVPNLQKFNKHFNKSLQRANSDGKVIITENGDISEMYTALVHDSVIASVEWLLDKHFYRRRGVCIPKDRDQQPYFSNCATDPDNVFFLTKAEILAVIKFDLANIFFVCRGQLLRQIVGIAMGSPGSPAVAILGCAYSEDLFQKFLLTNHFLCSARCGFLFRPLHGRPFVLCPRF
jgi:hypothetical protein